MSATLTIDLPQDLAAQVDQLEAVPQKFISWLRFEMKQEAKRKSPSFTEAQEIVKRAMERAEQTPMTEAEKDAARTTFVDRYETMIEGLKEHV